MNTSIRAAEWLASQDGQNEVKSLGAWWHRHGMPVEDAADLACRARECMLVKDVSQPMPWPVSWHVVCLRNTAAEIRRHDAQKFKERTDILNLLPPGQPVAGCTGSNYDGPGDAYEALQPILKAGVPLAYVQALEQGYNGAASVKVCAAPVYRRSEWNSVIESVLGTPVIREVKHDGPLSGRYNSWHAGGRTVCP